MFFSPIILTAFKPYICNYVPSIPSVPLLPEIKDEIIFGEKVNSLSCAVQKFTQLIPQLRKIKLQLTTDYMNLNEKNCSIELLQTQEFITFYFRTINRYKATYASQKTKYSWGQQDISILLWATNWIFYKYSTNPVDFPMKYWQQVASIIPFRSGEDCMFKWLSMRKNQLQQSPWLPSQKQQLVLIVSKIKSTTPPNWSLVSKQLFRRISTYYRTAKQCKQCWNIILSSSFQRSNKFWSEQQDNTLLQSFNKLGRKWKIISSIMQGRSQNAIKNRFNLLTQRSSKNKKISDDISQNEQKSLSVKQTNNSN